MMEIIIRRITFKHQL